jgi:ATP-grasp ribosomal peptide maturase
MDDRTVLVVTSLDDVTADGVIRELDARGVPVARLDLAELPRYATVSVRTPPWGGNNVMSGNLCTASRAVDLSAVRALYYRRPGTFRFPPMAPEDRRFAFLQAGYGFGGVLASLPNCLYVNHPARESFAEAKPAQWAAATAVGFRVPPTLLTNSPDEARTFAAEVGRVVYKPLRTIPMHDPDGKSLTMYVAEADPAGLDESIRHTAHVLQSLVEKTADIRVTVVGSRVFAVRIDSGILDWRADYTTHTYAVIDTPPGLAAAMHTYLAQFGLAFGVFDFALDQEDEWHFLECNPNGQWLWLENATGLPVTAAVADLLQGGAAGYDRHR